MKTYIFFCVWFCFNFDLYAQINLVPNPSFETYVECPDAHEQIERAMHWYSISDRAFATGSLLHGCSDNPDIRPPFVGGPNYDPSHQYPRTGNAHALITTFSDGAFPHEYIAVKLIQPLTKGSYYLSVFASPAEETRPSLWQAYADGLGLKLFKEEFKDDNYTYKDFGEKSLDIKSDVENDNGIISDTIGWTKVDGCYKAKGGEQYLVLGNFKSGDSTSVVREPVIFGVVIRTFIDDVGVYAFDPLPDTLTLCPGESATYDASFLESETRWSTGEETAVATIDTRGWHYVDAIIDNVVLRDSMYVMMSDLETIAIDTVICEAESFAVKPKMTGDYIWSTGETTPAIAAYESGIYSATITDDCTKGYYDLDLTIEDCECDVFLPNAVSANYDGINDDFEAMISCLTDYTATLAIYNRYGGLVFEQDYGANERVRWRPEQLQHLGVYVYVLTVETPIRKRQYSGSVTLLR